VLLDAGVTLPGVLLDACCLVERGRCSTRCLVDALPGLTSGTWSRTVYAIALVAQWREQWFPKPKVACSIHAKGAMLASGDAFVYLDIMSYLVILALSLWVFYVVVHHIPYEDGWSGDDSDEPEL
jgi:hypothetical protein